MSGLRRFLPKLSLVLGSLALTFGALELLARRGIPSQTIYRSTAIEETHVSRPGQPDFRLPVGDLGEKGSSFRILVIGDSFAWGAGVYAVDAFPHRLETRLNAVSSAQPAEVVNWSRPGWNTARQVGSLRKGRKLAWLQPDLMILGFVLNDPEPVDLQDRETLMREIVEHEAASGLSTWLLDHSRLYEFVWTRLGNTRSHRVLRAYYRSLFRGEHWDACRRALRDLEKMSRNHRAPLLLVIFPVFDGPMDDAYHYPDLHAKVREVGQELGIPVLDLLDAYRGVDGYRLSVTPFSDAHPNELAHRLAADAILDFLVRNEWVPGTDR
jgi:lysophospholipase L1-like esterase